MKTKFLLIAPAMMLVLPGCVSTVAHVVTAPVRVTSKAADWATTSQSEADRNYGRKMRKQEARDGKAQKKADEDRRRQCRKAGSDNCD